MISQIAYEIKGYEKIKTGLVLSLFSEKLHILIIGDTGLDKTSLLKALSRYSSKWILTSSQQ